MPQCVRRTNDMRSCISCSVELQENRKLIDDSLDKEIMEKENRASKTPTIITHLSLTCLLRVRSPSQRLPQCMFQLPAQLEPYFFDSLYGKFTIFLSSLPPLIADTLP
ncbi:hypothetical protein Y032_0194g1425 [Ancylostoma ceylanicum]|uniref:Uncharacterized protein n=1 Tax=Ancylostoma ceylanicum TaxID=53326 RepID=A0A016SPU2_9BILA|nr:hypothetical protein Y032_0194g1425 [Ancylostoma ceylanicum]